MRLFDMVERLFEHHDDRTITVGHPLTLRNAKDVLSIIAVHQPLADMRKVAEAVKELEEQCPQYVTFGMSHYYSEPKRVRFQSEGGRFVDADAIAEAFSSSRILQDECEIQHRIGDIADNREHRDPDHTPAVSIEPLVTMTREQFNASSPDSAAIRHAWLFALYDQLDDITEATQRNLTPLAEALAQTAGIEAPDPVPTEDAMKATMRKIIIDLLRKDTQDDILTAACTALANPDDESTNYMTAVEILRKHGVNIADTVTLTR